MSKTINSGLESLMGLWINASLTDYAHLVLAVVLVGWFISKINSK